MQLQRTTSRQSRDGVFICTSHQSRSLLRDLKTSVLNFIGLCLDSRSSLKIRPVFHPKIISPSFHLQYLKVLSRPSRLRQVIRVVRMLCILEAVTVTIRKPLLR